jgi:hypothetical protein
MVHSFCVSFTFYGKSSEKSLLLIVLFPDKRECV